MTNKCTDKLLEIDLFRLRDIAFEYLPDVKAKMKANRIFLKNHEAYYTELFTSATTHCKRSSTAIELVSIRLLQAISSHALYDENDQEQQEEGITPQEMMGFTIDSISESIKALSQLTGQTIALYADNSDCVQPANMLNTNVERPEKNTRQGLISDKRLLSLNHYMGILEQTAIDKGIDFDKQNLLCSKKMGGGSNLLFHLIKLGEIENLYHHTQMKCYQEISCPNCRCSTLMKSGRNAEGIQRYRCKNSACPTQTFMLDYRYNACMPGVKEKVVEMAINSSGIRDTARVLKINKNTVISILKSKEDSLVQVNPIFLSQQAETPLDVRLELVCEEAELDEQWSFVGKKSNQRWLWHAVDHATNTVIAYVFGKRKDDVFKELKTLLTPFNISRYYTDDWGAYERNLETNEHEIGKRNTQKIERKNLNFRTWIKRLTRRTICFSKIEKMHDIVIGLLINKVEFGRNIHA